MIKAEQKNLLTNGHIQMINTIAKDMKKLKLLLDEKLDIQNKKMQEKIPILWRLSAF